VYNPSPKCRLLVNSDVLTLSAKDMPREPCVQSGVCSAVYPPPSQPPTLPPPLHARARARHPPSSAALVR